MQRLPVQNFNTLPENDQIVFAPQQYAVIRKNYNNSGIRYIGTFGLAPCIGFVLYRAATHSGLVAHFDSDADDLSSPFSALNVANALYRTFTTVAGGAPTSALIVQGTGLMEGVPVKNAAKFMRRALAGTTAKAALYEVCDNFHVPADLVETRSGDLVLSLDSGVTHEINYALGGDAPQWFRLARALQRSSGGQISIYRLHVPFVEPSVYVAP